MAPPPNAQNTAASSVQRVVIPNDDGENLVGVLHDSGSTELVVLCHGFQSTKEDRTLVYLINELRKEGVSCFHFDFAGNGESEGVFQYGNYWKEARDLRTVVLYLSDQNYEISAIIGHSKGGNVALLYASRYRDVRSIFNISGRFALERGMEGRLGKGFMERIKKDGFIDVKDRTGKVLYRVTEGSLTDWLNTNMHAACLSIDKDIRLLTVHGSADETVPAEDAYKFAELIPNHELQIIEGANHNYTAQQDGLASIVLDFIKPSRVLPPSRENRIVYSSL